MLELQGEKELKAQAWAVNKVLLHLREKVVIIFKKWSKFD
jgi:hypothetical protein